MENYNNYHYGLSLLETMFGISIPEEDYEEISLVGWNLIGNKRCKLYRTSICVDSCQQSIELPCNADILEAVTTDFEDFQHVDNNSPTERYGSFETEQYIENWKKFKQPLYIPGKYIPYERVGNTLYFDKDNVGNRINILYRGIVLDDSGLPEITDKEALALATYCAYVVKFKEGLMTNNANAVQLAAVLQQQWNTRCDQARIDYQWSQNNYDEVLDVKTNWDRKIHGKSLKLIR